MHPTVSRSGAVGRRPAVPLLAAMLLLAGCAAHEQRAQPQPVLAELTADGVRLAEAGRPILFYRSRAEAGRELWRTNYVHPLYSVDGAVLTEDAPPDHLHQRGVYWAWRRILVDGVRVADGWVGENLTLDSGPPGTRAWPDGSMQIEARIIWRAPVQGVQTAIVEEQTAIRAYPLQDGRRRIDFDIQLRALRSGVQIAGTDDEKGYGGFSMRFGHADQLGFDSAGRTLQAAVAAVETGADVNFRWQSPGPAWPGTVRANCRVDGRPWQSWVLRRELSMQNCAFPGRSPVDLPAGKPLSIQATIEL